MATYQAFISYKHAANFPMGQRIAGALRSYARPLFKSPPRIFRDEDFLVPDNSLPKLIGEALKDSEFLILLASPAAAASPWVQDEVRIWCHELQRKDSIILVLTRGEIAVDAETQRICWERTDALPALLRDVFEEVPLFVDLRAADQIEKLDLADPDFKKAINAISARLRGTSPDELGGEEVRVFRRNRRIRTGAIIVFAVLTLLLAVLFVLALRALDGERAALARAEAENAQVRASLIATRAEQIRARAPQAAALVAAEAVRRLFDRGLEPTTATLQTLLDSLESAGGIGLVGHAARVTAVAISPDSRWLASGDAAGELLLREARDPGRLVHRFKGHEGEIRHIEFEPAGTRILASATNEARVWSIEAPATPPVILGDHDHYVYRARFNANSPHMVTASGTGARVWSFNNGAPVAVSAVGPSGQVTDARFALGGDIAVLRSQDGLWTWRWKDANAAPQLLAPGDKFYTMSLSRDGRRLAAGTTTGDVRVWDLAGKPAPTHAFQHDGFVHAVAFNDDASRVASASMDRTARVWALSEKQRPLVFKHPDEVLTVAFCANGKALATGGKDRVVRLWSTYELYTPRPVEIAGHEGGGGVSMMAVSGDGRFMLTGGYEEVPRLRELDRLDPRVIELRGHGYQEMESLAVARQTRRLAATSRYELPSVWDLAHPSAGALQLKKAPQNAFQVALSRDGRWVATTSLGAPSFLWDLTRPDAAPRRLAAYVSDRHKGVFTPDGSRIATPDADGSIVLEPTADAGIGAITLSGGGAGVRDFDIDPEGRHLVAVYADGSAFVWDIPGGKPRQLAPPGPSLHRVRFGAKGRFAAAIGERPTVRLWTLATGRDRMLTLPDGSAATTVAFDEQERYLAVGTKAGLVVLFDLARDGTASILRSHTDAVVALDFDPSGRWLASATVRDGIRLWNPAQPEQSPLRLTSDNFRTIPGTSDSSTGVVNDIAFVEPGLLAVAKTHASIHLWNVDPHAWLAAATAVAGRSLTGQEVVKYLEQDVRPPPR